jgi:hypothetical protein
MIFFMRLSEKLGKTFQTAFKTVVVCIPGSINIRACITMVLVFLFNSHLHFSNKFSAIRTSKSL